MRPDPQPRLPSIRSKSTWLVLACALPTAAGVGILIHHFFQREQSQIASDAVHTAQALMAAVEREHGTGGPMPCRKTASRRLMPAWMLPSGTNDAGALIRVADAHLYRAKVCTIPTNMELALCVRNSLLSIFRWAV